MIDERHWKDSHCCLPGMQCIAPSWNARHLSGCKTQFIKVIDKTWASGKHRYFLLITIHVFCSCEMHVYLKVCLKRKRERGWLRMEVTQVGAAFNVTVLQRIQAVKTQRYTSY